MPTRRAYYESQANRIEAVLHQHRTGGVIDSIVVTPRFVQFHIYPRPGTKVSRIQGLSEEIGLALGSHEVRIYRKGGRLHVEVPRPDPSPVLLLPICRQLPKLGLGTGVLGVDDTGIPVLMRLPAPDVTHVLIAGTTGSGKSALARSFLTSLALLHPKEELRLILIDPKARGFLPLTRLPHSGGKLWDDHEGIAAVLDDLLHEMLWRDRNGLSRPVLVIAIDELSDLIQSGGKEIGDAITRIAQRGREAGLHLVACTQKPTAGLIGGAVKANFPVRLVGAVSGKDEARYATGIKDSGAESLAGKGDFLLIAKGEAATRFQAAWIAPEEVGRDA